MVGSSMIAFTFENISKTSSGNFLKKIYKTFVNTIFYLKFIKYKNIKKIIYAITPSPNLSNVGDHAQAVAITKWLKDNFDGYVLLEFNKDEIYRYLVSIKKIVANKDLIFLHSGGNLGDKGLWSENARRSIVKNFPENKIISLPQTIFFSDTPKGRKELETTKEIYNNHKNFTIMARDEYSFVLAKKYFPKCKTMLFPDFVLYLKPNIDLLIKKEKVLLCLRDDYESSIDKETNNYIRESIKNVGEDYNEYDTTINRYILKKNRDKELRITLNFFNKHKLVITDRLHGLIFSAITNTPCIALKTADHKLAESVKWFRELNYVFYVENNSELLQTISRALKVVPTGSIEWKKIYFDNLKKNIISG